MERDFRQLALRAGRDYAEIGVAYSAAEDSVEALNKDCERLLPLERRRGYSLAGPHRDDLVWTRRGRPLSPQASSGEIARAVALVKLAEWRAVHRAVGEPPLLGADDFDAGLSESWVEEFFDALPGEAAVLLDDGGSPVVLVAACLGRARGPRGIRVDDAHPACRKG